jgi:fibronectin-binding autotransporter adhesin
LGLFRFTLEKALPCSLSLSLRTLPYLFAIPFTVANAFGDPYNWSGAGTDGNWSTAQNWVFQVAPPNDGTADIIMTHPVQLSNTVDVPWSIDSLTFGLNGGDFSIAGSTLTIGAGGIVNSGSFQPSLSAPIVLSANQTWNAGTRSGANLGISGPIDTNGYGLTFTGTDILSLDGTVTGSGSLICDGPGTLYVVGPNSYSGGTYIDQGVLYILGDSALGAAAGSISFDGGTLDFDVGNITINRDISLGAGGGTIVASIAQNDKIILSGAISGSGSLDLQGNGGAYVQLEGDNTYTGGNVVNGFTLLGTTDTIKGNVSLTSLTAQLQFQQDGNGTFSGNISGAGELLKSGAGIVTLTGDNTYSGDTELYTGVLEVFASGSGLSPQSRIDFEDVPNKADGAVVQFVGGGTFSRTLGSGVIWNGSGGFSARGGELIVNLGGAGAPFTLNPVDPLIFGSPTADSVTDFQNPLLLGTNGVTTPVPTIQVNQGVGGDYAILSGQVSGNNELYKAGTGTLVLTAASSYTGPTDIGAGVLVIDGSLAKTSVTVESGASLAGAGSIGGVVSVVGGTTAATRGAIDLVDGSFDVLTLSDTSSSDAVLTLGSTAGDASSMDFEVGNGADEILDLAGRIVVGPGGAIIDVVPLGELQPGTYDLIQFPSGQATGLDLITLAASSVDGFSLTLQTTSTAEQLVVSPEPVLISGLPIGALYALARRRAGTTTRPRARRAVTESCGW